jgi:hypothetical protein
LADNYISNFNEDAERQADGFELLSELSRATTAYFDASPESVEDARVTYLNALRVFKYGQGSSDDSQ